MSFKLANSLKGSASGIARTIREYERRHRTAGRGKREKASGYKEITDLYYDVATDFYEFGWGRSFHFAPRVPGESFKASLARHEHYLAHKLGLEPRMQLARELHEFVSLCVEHGLRFLVVGGYAVAAHGHPRLTKDLDVWVWVDSENATRMAEVLDEFGFGSLGLSADDFTVEGQVVQLGYPPNRIGIMTSIAGVDFEGCWERRTEFLLDSVAVPFIGIEDLERNKLAVGRFQDLADVEALRRNRASPPESYTGSS